MPDYKKSKIYKLVSYETDAVYYGSTINPLYKRLGGHKTDFMRWFDGKCSYISSFELVMYPDVKIILVEEYPCDNKQQLERREREYIENNQCVNKNVPTRELICEHNTKRFYCKLCGSGSCEHDKRREDCKKCHGGQICEHDKRRYACKKCGGRGICQHGKHKQSCRPCGEKMICEHDKYKQSCKECDAIPTK
jgi:hypothetical protein